MYQQFEFIYIIHIRNLLNFLKLFALLIIVGKRYKYQYRIQCMIIIMMTYYL